MRADVITRVGLRVVTFHASVDELLFMSSAWAEAFDCIESTSHKADFAVADKDDVWSRPGT